MATRARARGLPLVALAALATLSALAIPREAHAESAPPPAGPLLGEEQLLARALAASPAVRAARARVEGATAQAKGARGRLLPAIGLSEEVQRWDSPFVVAFPPPLGNVTARDHGTSTFVASVGQPLLGLLSRGEELAAQGSATAAAEADLRTAEAEARQVVLSQLLQLFEARALGEVARASRAQLDEQREVARARLAAGVVTRADVLRIETAAANAEQQVIQSEAQGEAARASLLVSIGEDPEGAAVDFADPRLTEPEPAPTLSDALRAARARRPELASARRAEESAEQRARARTFDLLPEVNAEAAYLHVTGQSFQPENASFIGLRVEWPIWDWGAKWYARSAAQSQAEAARAQGTGAGDRVTVEVASRLAALRAAGSAVGVARKAVESAEEAYRVTGELVRAGTATTTDLLDAQSASTAARQNLARSRYGHALARLDLLRATGEL